jgi:hypothetical protein
MRRAQSEFSNAHKGAIGLTVIGESICALELNKHASIEDALRAVASGKAMRRHKDIVLAGSKVHASVPKEHAEAVYSELLKRLGV